MAIAKIAQATVGAGGTTSGISFTSIPQTYTDLILHISLMTQATYGIEVAVNINGNIASQYATSIQGSGTAASLSGGQGVVLISDSDWGSVNVYIPNYTNTSENKILSSEGVSEANTTTARQLVTAARNSLTSAVTTLTVQGLYSDSIRQYSSVTLYGISKTGASGATVA